MAAMVTGEADSEDQSETSDEDDSSSSSSATPTAGERGSYMAVSDWAAECVDATHTTKWKVDRKASDFLESVFAEYEKVREPSKKVLRRPLEITFEGEAGIDAGGLTKEFFHLAFEAVLSRTYKDCAMFEGERGQLIPSAGAEHLVNGYKYVGMMIVHAVKNGCRGLPGLSPAIQHYIVHGDGPATIDNTAHLVSVDDVADTGLKNLLLKLNDGDTLTDADNELLMSWMERCNCRLMLKENTRQLISQSILINYVFNSRLVQIDAISKGMDMFEFREFLRQNPSDENLALVFPSQDDVEVTPEMLTAVSVFCVTADSTDHEQTFDFFQLFLRELYDGQIANKKLSDLLQFVCATPHLPAQLILTFSKEIVYPVAHACFNELELPTTHQHYAAFRDAFAFALQHGTAFTTE